MFITSSARSVFREISLWEPTGESSLLLDDLLEKRRKYLLRNTAILNYRVTNNITASSSPVTNIHNSRQVIPWIQRKGDRKGGWLIVSPWASVYRLNNVQPVIQCTCLLIKDNRGTEPRSRNGSRDLAKRVKAGANRSIYLDPMRHTRAKCIIRPSKLTIAWLRSDATRFGNVLVLPSVRAAEHPRSINSRNIADRLRLGRTRNDLRGSAMFSFPRMTRVSFLLPSNSNGKSKVVKWAENLAKSRSDIHETMCGLDINSNEYCFFNVNSSLPLSSNRTCDVTSWSSGTWF